MRRWGDVAHGPRAGAGRNATDDRNKVIATGRKNAKIYTRPLVNALRARRTYWTSATCRGSSPSFSLLWRLAWPTPCARAGATNVRIAFAPPSPGSPPTTLPPCPDARQTRAFTTRLAAAPARSAIKSPRAPTVPRGVTITPVRTISALAARRATTWTLVALAASTGATACPNRFVCRSRGPTVFARSPAGSGLGLGCALLPLTGPRTMVSPSLAP